MSKSTVIATLLAAAAFGFPANGVDDLVATEIWEGNGPVNKGEIIPVEHKSQDIFVERKSGDRDELIERSAELSRRQRSPRMCDIEPGWVCPPYQRDFREGWDYVMHHRLDMHQPLYEPSTPWGNRRHYGGGYGR